MTSLAPFMQGFEFAWPWTLWALLIVPWLAWRLGRVGPIPSITLPALEPFRSLGHLPRRHAGRRRWVLPLTALTLLLVALARPRTPRGDLPDPTRGIDIMLTLDFSRSMAEEDFHLGARRISRREALLQVVEDFVNRRPHDRIGIVCFARSPFLVSPLTMDHDWALNSLKETDYATGTAIGEGIAASLQFLKQNSQRSKVIILVTDGVNLIGRPPLLVAPEVLQAQVRLYTVIIGPEIVTPTAAAGHELNKAARLTGGQFFQARDTENLKKVYELIDQLEKKALLQKAVCDLAGVVSRADGLRISAFAGRFGNKPSAPPNSMKFVAPHFLYALPAVWLAVGLALWVARRRRSALFARFVGGNSRSWAGTGSSSIRQKWDVALLFLSISALLTALARPIYFSFDPRSESQGAAYLIALDVSRSMMATDVKPSRYSAATNVLTHYFEEARSDRIGLLTFAGIGYLNAPLTFDSRALQTILSYVNPGSLMDPGSSMASAMDRAARYFTSNAVPQRTLIFLSDGEELDGGKALELARRLKRDHRITIHTIGVGTAAGAVLRAFPSPPGLVQAAVPPSNISNQPASGAAQPASAPEITTKMDENNLRRIAIAGGGHFYRLGENGEGLRQLREEVLRPLAEKVAREDLQNYLEGYFVPLIVAALALISRLILGADRFARRRALPSIAESSS